MNIKMFFDKIGRRLKKLRLQPIRVFCFHETSNVYDNSPDWIPLSYLQSMLTQLLKQGYKFITLKEAYQHISNDKIRLKKYAVLTADDGLKCQLELLPWLMEHNIPITFFLNVLSLQQEKCGLPYRNWYHIDNAVVEQKYAKKLYFSKQDLQNAAMRYPLFSIAMHGVNHDEDSTQLSEMEFRLDVESCVNGFSSNEKYIPFYAYKYGKHNEKNDMILRELNIVPVLSNGGRNYNNSTYIDREIIEVIYKKCQQEY